MSDIDLPEVETITVGSIGEPGSRIFYLQVWSSGQIRSLKLEKQQVAALGAALAEVLADVVVEDAVALPDLLDPGEAEWAVGTMGLTGFDDSTGRVTLVLQELVAEEGDEGSVARLGLTVAQLAALASRCEESVEGGRPSCPLCGRPMDPEGHACPKTNGASKH